MEGGVVLKPSRNKNKQRTALRKVDQSGGEKVEVKWSELRWYH